MTQPSLSARPRGYNTTKYRARYLRALPYATLPRTMLDCLARLFLHATFEFATQWLRDWGNLLLTAAIAVAAFMQGIFAMRLYKLQNSIEQSRLQPFLFCRIAG